FRACAGSWLSRTRNRKKASHDGPNPPLCPEGSTTPSSSACYLSAQLAAIWRSHVSTPGACAQGHFYPFPPTVMDATTTNKEVPAATAAAKKPLKVFRLDNVN